MKRALTAALLLLTSALPTAQQPTFRVSVEAVETDAFVTDAQGNPVTGLTESDFQILEDGKPQAITSFSQVDIPFERRPDGLGAPGAVQPDAQSNDHGDGRIYLFVLDEVAPELALRSRAFLRSFLDRHFGANDRGAVVFLGHQNTAAAQMFTSNPRLLLASFDSYTGIFPTEDVPTIDGDSEASARMAELVESLAVARRAEAKFAGRDTMAGLKSAVEAIARLRGRKKALLLFSSGLPPAIFRALSYQGGVMTVAEESAHAAVTAATRGNVTIYPIDPAGLTTGMTDVSADRPPQIDRRSDDPAKNGLQPLDNRQSLTMLAGATGGFAVFNSNNFAQSFDRIVRENSTYYLLGFTSTNEKRDGRHRRVQIRVTRPGLQVRSRDGYMAPLKNERLPDSPRVAALSAPVAAALTNPLASGAVPIRIVATPYSREDKDALVAIAAEIDPAALGLVERNGIFSGKLEVGFLAADVHAKVYHGARYAVDLALKASTYSVAQKQGIRVLSEIHLPPGRYQLHFAAGNPNGNAGNIVYDLLVPDFSKPALTLSGIALTSATVSGEATLAAKDPLKAFLPRPLTARREFDTGDTLALFGEVYGGGPGEGVEVHVELRGEGGKPVQTVRAQAPRFLVEVPLTGVSAGSYVVHVGAISKNGKTRTAGRDILISVR